MSYIDVLAVEVMDENPADYTADIKFKITFQCRQKTKEDLDWRIRWVGSAKDESFDQILDEVAVPPDVGVNTFEYIVDAPDHKKIPGSDILGVTVVMVQALYKTKEFLRVGYYVKVDYKDEKLREEPPEVEVPDVTLLQRHILTAEPRVTRYLIEWDSMLTSAPVSDSTTPEQQALAGGPEGIAQPQFQAALEQPVSVSVAAE